MTAEELWQAFLRYDVQTAGFRKQRGNRTPVLDGSFTWGDSPQAIEDMLDAVIAGTCTARIFGLRAWQRLGEPVPTAGHCRVLLNARGEAVCIIRSERSYLVALRDIREEWALREGRDPSFFAWKQRVRDELLRDAAETRLPFSMHQLMAVDLFTVAYYERDEKEQSF